MHTKLNSATVLFGHELEIHNHCLEVRNNIDASTYRWYSGVIVGAVIECTCKMIAHDCKLGAQLVERAHLVTLVHYLLSQASAASQTQGCSPHGDSCDCVHSSP